jgi:CubicO group peptidase (beta-lactamase class C family)
MSASLRDHHDVRSQLDLLASWTDALRAYRGWPGVSVGIVHDQDVLWSQGFGAADLEAKSSATPDTLYRVASITKTFTATALLQLRDAGKLRLDDEVRAHLPWFTPPARYPEASPITLRHILTHTTGLAREAPFPYWTDLRFPGLDEIREAIAAQDPVLPTDDRWKYSNLAFVIAGEVVAAVSGMPWAAYVRAHLLEPLGMRASLVDNPRDGHPGLARGYTRRLPNAERTPVGPYDLRGVSAAAALTTSVTDLARFVAWQLATGSDTTPQIVRRTTLREMQRVHWLEPDWQAGWGLGFHMYRANGRTLIGHGGSLRGYRSEVRFAPDASLGVIVLINADDGEPRLIVDKAFEWVAPAVTRATAPPPPAADPAWQRYVGRYRNHWGDAEVLVVGGRLTLIGPNLPDPMGAPGTLVPIGEHTFRLETKDGYGSHGERVVFEMDDAGRVARLTVGYNWIFPVTEW